MKSIFKGKHIQKVYKFDNYSDYKNNKIPYVILINEVVGYETILETDLDAPPLGRGDIFYLTEEDKIVKIETILRGTDNVMVYLVDVVLSEKKELDESLKTAIKEREAFSIQQEDINKRYEQQREIRKYQDAYNNAFFIVRWFMTKPE